MKPARSFVRPWWVRCLAATLAFMLGAGPLMAAELRLELRLIWCTDDDNYKNPKHKKVDPATTASICLSSTEAFGA